MCQRPWWPWGFHLRWCWPPMTMVWSLAVSQQILALEQVSLVQGLTWPGRSSTDVPLGSHLQRQARASPFALPSPHWPLTQEAPSPGPQVLASRVVEGQGGPGLPILTPPHSLYLPAGKMLSPTCPAFWAGGICQVDSVCLPWACAHSSLHGHAILTAACEFEQCPSQGHRAGLGPVFWPVSVLWTLSCSCPFMVHPDIAGHQSQGHPRVQGRSCTVTVQAGDGHPWGQGPRCGWQGMDSRSPSC